MENKIVVKNPMTGLELGSLNCTVPEELQDILKKAKNAQIIWAAQSIKERAKIIKEFRDLIIKDAEDIAKKISEESGKTIFESLFMELYGTIGLISYFANHSKKILKDKKIKLHLLKNKSSYIKYVPMGVIGIISPSNFPFAIPLSETIMALLAGNAVILKPSPITPLIALYIKNLFDKTDLPRDLFHVVFGYGEIGQALISSGVNKIYFTGSVNGGRAVASACAKEMIPCVLELGGKAPAIILSDADPERTAKALVWGAFANQGQVCASVERVYVEEALHDLLLNKILMETKNLRFGDNKTCETEIGAINLPNHISLLEEQIKDAVYKGAKIEFGGTKKESNGQTFIPTILSNCTSEMRIMHEECFGPILPIMKVKNYEEALVLSNNNNLGLCAYVFTQNKKLGKEISNKLEAGDIMINDVLSTYAIPETPWHGIKLSGMGKVHSDDGLRAMCYERHVNYYSIRPFSTELWWYPYSKTKFKLGLFFLKKALKYFY
jgi:succinate-semialdehyde dehydrogenase/glutarate-semialdehyde dehydrogenase